MHLRPILKNIPFEMPLLTYHMYTHVHAHPSQNNSVVHVIYIRVPIRPQNI